jgi:tetratricopeptide (TPR) repeat protein
MSEPVDTMDTLEESLLTSDYPDEYEMATNRLASGVLTRERQSLEDVDWLLNITKGGLATEVLPDDDEPGPAPRPSGMSAHTAPPRMKPTVGARVSTGLKRGTLLLVLSAIGVGALAAGGYLLASTSWLSNLFATPALPQASQPSTDTEVQLPAPAAAQQEPQTQVQPESPAGQIAGDGLPADIAATFAGMDARDLRDKGVAQYREGNYQEAARLLEESVTLSGDDPVTQYQLGLTYMALPTRPHALDDAELAFRTAISLQAQWAAPHQMLGESLLRRGYYNEAIAPALEATRLDPNMAEAWLTLGRAYKGAGMDAEATNAFAQAQRTAPAPPPAP